MKIALIAPEFPPDIGGMQTYAVCLARTLANRGHQITVFTQAGQTPFYPELQIVDGLRFRRRYDLPLFDRYTFDAWHVLNAGYAWLATHKAPVFVSVYGNDFLNPWVLSESLDLRTRLCLPFGSQLDRIVGKRLSARAINRGFTHTHHTFACSRYSESAFLERYPQCKGRSSVAYVGVSVPSNLVKPKTCDSSACCEIVTVCRLADTRKNVDIVLRALGLLREKYAFRYTVVGDGSLRAELEKVAAESGVGDRVRFTGRVSNEELHRYLSGGDLFVLTSGLSPTSFEGFGIVYLEANAHGVPVLAARCAGAVEAVEEGVSGWFVDQITPEKIACALAAFFRGDMKFSPVACQRFANRFTWEKLGEHVLSQYEGS